MSIGEENVLCTCSGALPWFLCISWLSQYSKKKCYSYTTNSGVMDSHACFSRDNVFSYQAREMQIDQKGGLLSFCKCFHSHACWRHMQCLQNRCESLLCFMRRWFPITVHSISHSKAQTWIMLHISYVRHISHNCASCTPVRSTDKTGLSHDLLFNLFPTFFCQGPQCVYLVPSLF